MEKPIAPDMSSLIALYESPTGTVDETSLPGALDAARRIAEQIETLRIDAALLDLVQDAADALSSSGARAAGSEGYFQATRACAGWQPQPAPAEGNGRIELTVGFSELGLDAVVWGQTIACEYLSEGRSVLLYGPSGGLAGEVRLSFDGTVAFDRVAGQRVLLDLDATAEVDGTPAPANFDFRLDPSLDTREVRVPVSDGDVIVVSSGDELSSVRAANGDFTVAR